MGLESSPSVSSAASDSDVNSAIFQHAVIEEAHGVHKFDESEFVGCDGKGIFDQNPCYTSENSFVRDIGDRVVCKTLENVEGILQHVYYCDTQKAAMEGAASRAASQTPQSNTDTKKVTTATPLHVRQKKQGTTATPVSEVTSRDAPNPREKIVKDILGHRSAIENSRFDISGLSKSQRALLMFAEFKISSGDVLSESTLNDIRQTSAYALIALAYGRWGLMGQRNTTPISALLIYPKRIYRLSFQKPENSSTHPFGVHLKIECTEDLDLMGAVLMKYLKQYQEDWGKLTELDFMKSWVDPIDWSPVNFPFEEPSGERFAKRRSPNFGFLFYSSMQKVKEFIEETKLPTIPAPLPQLELQTRIIVKVVSALLVTKFADSRNAVMMMLREDVAEAALAAALAAKDAEIAAKDADAAAALAAKDADAAAALAAKDAEIAARDAEIAARDAYIQRLIEGNISRPSTAAEESKQLESVVVTHADNPGVNVAPADKAESSYDDPPPSSANVDKDVGLKEPMAGAPASAIKRSADSFPFSPVIKHPYVGMLTGTHSVLFMEDKGLDLAEILNSNPSEFRARWNSDTDLRRAFYFDVGQSMWNLVSRMHLINNDVRLPNITISGNSFCPIDYDMCHPCVEYSFKGSKVFASLDFKLEATMHLASLIQISFIVFLLASEGSVVETESAATVEKSLRNQFLKGKIVKASKQTRAVFDAFPAWLTSKGSDIPKWFAHGGDDKMNQAKFSTNLQSLLSLTDVQL